MKRCSVSPTSGKCKPKPQCNTTSQLPAVMAKSNNKTGNAPKQQHRGMTSAGCFPGGGKLERSSTTAGNGRGSAGQEAPGPSTPGASLRDLRPAAWTGVCGGEGSLAHRAPKGKQAVPVRERGLSPHRNFIQPPKTVTFGHRPQHGEPRRQQAKWSEGSNAGAGHQRPAAPGAAGGGGGPCEKGGGSGGTTARMGTVSVLGADNFGNRAANALARVINAPARHTCDG